MDFISSISFPNEPLISGTFLGTFGHHFWMGLLLHPTKRDDKNVQLTRGSFGKEILLMKSIL